MVRKTQAQRRAQAKQHVGIAALQGQNGTESLECDALSLPNSSEMKDPEVKANNDNDEYNVNDDPQQDLVDWMQRNPWESPPESLTRSVSKDGMSPALTAQFILDLESLALVDPVAKETLEELRRDFQIPCVPASAIPKPPPRTRTTSGTCASSSTAAPQTSSPMTAPM